MSFTNSVRIETFSPGLTSRPAQAFSTCSLKYAGLPRQQELPVSRVYF